MSERIPYVGPRQENFSLPRRLGHKRSISLLPSHPRSPQDVSPITEPPPSAPGLRSRLTLPSLAISLSKTLSNELMPSSPTPSDFVSSPRISYSPFERRLWASPTSATAALEESLLELEELIRVLGTPTPVQLEFQTPEGEVTPGLPSQSADVKRTHFMPERAKQGNARACGINTALGANDRSKPGFETRIVAG
ncbi:hypothetical protein FRC06_005762 [Ceratobasidium sp. 370]|nr:hypothetical protein FRC06_005762 [Ceratobasidium sp. 370]